MNYVPKHRAPTATERLTEIFGKINQQNRVRYAPFEKPYCQEFSDCFDGFVVHAPTCIYYQHLAMSGSKCIELTHVSSWPTGLERVR